MISAFANAYHERMFPGYQSTFLKTDPEFIAFFDNFAFDTVVQQGQLDDVTRFQVILASLLGCQGINEFKAILPAALRFGVSPVEVKEIVYQAVAYLGIGRVFPFLKACNEIFQAEKISLPLEPQAAKTSKSRLELGRETLVSLMGEGMRHFDQEGPENRRHINQWLMGNCFGDYYSRSGLEGKKRELTTFCFLAAQGGCEPQLVSHAVANLKLGHRQSYLIDILSQCIPYIGYPRVLNALTCLEEAVRVVNNEGELAEKASIATEEG